MMKINLGDNRIRTSGTKTTATTTTTTSTATSKRSGKLINVLCAPQFLVLFASLLILPYIQLSAVAAAAAATSSSDIDNVVNNNNNNAPEEYGVIEHVYYDAKHLILTITGRGFVEPHNQDDIFIRLTSSPVDCNESNLISTEPVNIIYRNQTLISATTSTLKTAKTTTTTAAGNGNVFGRHPAAYLCFSADDGQTNVRHMGQMSRVIYERSSSRERRQSSFLQVHNEPDKVPTDIEQLLKEQQQKQLKITGLRVDTSDRDPSFNDEGVPEILVDTHAILRIFGTGLRQNVDIALTEEVNAYGDACLFPKTRPFRILNGSITPYTALVDIAMPLGKTVYYICARYAEENGTLMHANSTVPFMHQGAETWLRLGSYENLLPTWLAIVVIVSCLAFSALFSGLNLGLMSLDRTELKILVNTGTKKERRHAAIIQPIRDHGNYLLCSILLGNVLVNSTFTILLDGLTSGLIAVIFSTLLIVVFGEITPQAVCSRHGLAVGANTIYITKIVMLLTFPLSYPVSKFLDFLLGEEIGSIYNRERLKELVRITKDVNDLDKDEVNIISGALELRKKCVADVMTHMEDAFMLSYDAILDFETVSEIMKSGFSRVPVYEGNRKNVCTMLFIKDLAFVDPDDNTPLKTLCEYYQNPCHFVFEDVTLDVMFKQFKEGLKGHMAFVHKVNNEGDGDPFYETVGLITLEDVIEELIQAEIMDETDVYTDNRQKVRRLKTQKQDFTLFAERRENHRIRISPQLTLATFQYLTTTVDAFKSDIISETILRRLLNQDVVNHIKAKGKDRNDPSMIIYQQGKPSDCFVLILEGRVEVTVGRENLNFESGPFTYFGIQALVQNVGTAIDSPLQGSLQSLNVESMLRSTFVPDYSVRAVTEVFYISVKRTLYLAAKRATLMERSQRLGEYNSNEPLDDEVEKLLNSLDEDDRSIGAHTVNLNATTPKASKPSSNTPSPVHTDIHTNSNVTPVVSRHSTGHHISVDQKSPSKSVTGAGGGGAGGGGGGDDIESPLLPQSKY